MYAFVLPIARVLGEVVITAGSCAVGFMWGDAMIKRRARQAAEAALVVDTVKTKPAQPTRKTRR